MVGMIPGQSSGQQLYQGPMPFQMRQGMPTSGSNPALIGMSSSTLSINGMQGADSFGSNFGGMPQSGMSSGVMPQTQAGYTGMSGQPQMGQMGQMGGMGSLGISGSTLQLMSQIATMMASVMQGLMSFVQTLMQSAQQKQSQPTGTETTAPGTDSTGGTPTGTDTTGSPTGSDTSGSGKTSTGKPTSPKDSKGAPGDVKQDAKSAVKFFMDKGWSKAQAAGIVANLQHESGLRTDVPGDGGKAYGIAQWHPDRQANYTKFAKENGLKHTNIRQSTFAEQLAFVNHELTAGTEKAAGDKLKATTSSSSAAAAFCRYYERPADVEGQSAARAKSAAKLG